MRAQNQVIVKLMERAGVKRWAKAFHALRASAQNDFNDHLPEHVAAAIIGNTKEIGRKHYLSVTDDHLQAAAAIDGDTDGVQKCVQSSRFKERQGSTRQRAADAARSVAGGAKSDDAVASDIQSGRAVAASDAARYDVAL